MTERERWPTAWRQHHERQGGCAPDASSAAPCVPTGAVDGLGDLAARVLDFERRWWQTPGIKEDGIRAEFDISVTRYYQMVNRLIDDPAAMAADPMLVKRLRRRREERRRSRSARRLGTTPSDQRM